MELKELRCRIDEIDDQLVKLFVQRMEVSAQVAAYKKEHQLPIFVPAREQEKLNDVAQKAGPEMADYTKALYGAIFELSRSYQSKLMDEDVG
jgi:chorismate mutase/prephenate dehydratase